MQVAITPSAPAPATYRTSAHELPFVCSDCAAHHAVAGECACGAGPLFDLRDPAIADALREDDERRAERAKQRNIWIGVVVGMLVGGAIFAAASETILRIPLPLPFANPIKVVAMMIGITALTVAVLDRILRPKPRFPELSRR